MHDELDIETPRANGRDYSGMNGDYSGLAYWQMQHERRRRQRRSDMVGCALLVAAVAMGVLMGYALCLVVRGGA